MAVTVLAIASGLGGSFFLMGSPFTHERPLTAREGATVELPPAIPAREISTTAPLVIVLTLAGTPAEIAESVMADGTMRNLALLASNGVIAEYLEPVDPPSPAISHMSLACGAKPARTGIVGERFRAYGAPDDRVIQANAEINAEQEKPPAAPFWSWPGHDHRPRAILFWPGDAVQENSSHQIHVGLHTIPIASHRIDIPLEIMREAMVDEVRRLPRSFSPYRYGTVSILGLKGEHFGDLHIIVFDSSDNGRSDYDGYAIALVNPSLHLPPTYSHAPIGSWLTQEIPAVPHGSLAARLWLSTPDSPSRAAVFLSDAVALWAYPPELERLLFQEVGPPVPPPPAPKGAEDQWNGEPFGLEWQDHWLPLFESHLRWKTDAMIYIQREYAPLFILAAFDPIPHDGPRPAQSTTEWLYHSPARNVYRAVDRAIGRLLSITDLSQTTMLVLSPHGIAHGEIALNLRAVLADIVGSDTREAPIVYSSGGAAHILMRPDSNGTEGSGSVDRLSQAVQEIAMQLNQFTIEGRPVFSRVVTAGDMLAHDLPLSDSGGIFVQAMPGVILFENDPFSDRNRLWWFTDIPSSGYTSDEPSMRGFLVMAGARVHPVGPIGPVHLLDIAPTIGSLLGLALPDSIQGRPLQELIEGSTPEK